MQIYEIKDSNEYDEIVFKLCENLNTIFKELFNIKIEIKDNVSLETIKNLFEENNIPLDSYGGTPNIIESLTKGNLNMWGDENYLWCIIQTIWMHGESMGKRYGTLGDNIDYESEYYKILEERSERTNEAFSNSVEHTKLEFKYLASLKRTQSLLSEEDFLLNQEIRELESKLTMKKENVDTIITEMKKLLDDDDK